jgi:hypothetical protein
MTPGALYGFAIKALNVVGSSDLSTLSVIMSATVPDAPSTPLMVSQSETQITISWSPSANDGGSPLINYQLYWSENSFASPAFTVNADTTSHSFTDSDGVVTGQIYSFKVVATNYIGESLPSGVLENVVAGSLPTQPINFKRAVTVTPIDTKISLQWGRPVDDGGTDITGYVLMWNGGANGGAIPMDLLQNTDDLVTFFTQSNLVRG